MFFALDINQLQNGYFLMIAMPKIAVLFVLMLILWVFQFLWSGITISFRGVALALLFWVQRFCALKHLFTNNVAP